MSTSTCASAPASLETYNLPLHIGALFIILSVSFSACALPILALRIPSLHIPAKALFLFRHFGTGVLIATAFVHLFPTAFVNLTDPCLPAFFTEGYPAFAGAVALGSVFFITVAEMVFSPGRSLCAGPRVDEREDGGGEGEGKRDLGNHGGPVRSGRGHRKGSVNQLAGTQQEEDEIQQNSSPTQQPSHNDPEISSLEAYKTSFHRRKLLAQCALLECGILFHSIFIGMALAVATGSEQIILLIAISFHQTFEGLALGSRIAAIGWEAGALQPWGMALAYGCTYVSSLNMHFPYLCILMWMLM